MWLDLIQSSVILCKHDRQQQIDGTSGSSHMGRFHIALQLFNSCDCKVPIKTHSAARLKEREVSLHRSSSFLFKHFLYWALKGPTDLKLHKSFHDENTEEHWAASCGLVLRPSFQCSAFYLCSAEGNAHMVVLGPQKDIYGMCSKWRLWSYVCV